MTGSIVTFDDAIPFMPIEKLIATIEPQQDLHGYANPWPAGGGKNLLDATQNEAGGIDSSGVEVDGNFRRSSNYIPIKANTSYALWANNNWTVRLYWYDANKTFISPRINGNTGGKAIGTSPSNAVYARWSVYNANNVMTYEEVATSQLQLEEGANATAWTPYANECAITGWTGLSGERDGKNLLAFTPGTTRTNNGVTYTANNDYTVTISGTATATSFGLESARIKLKAGTYTLSASNATGVRTVAVVGATTPFIDGNSSTQFTITSETEVYVYCRVSNGTTVNTTPLIQIEAGSTASTYEPYTSLPIAVSWQTEAGTVYGGTVDVVTGVLTVDWKIVDLGTFTWTATSWGGWRTGNISDLKIVATDMNANLVAEKFKSVAQGAVSTTQNAIATGTFAAPQRLYVNSVDTPTGMCVYPLAEASQTYQLTSQQISTLLGENNVWVDTGNVSVTYQSTSGSTPVRTSFKSPLESYSYNALKLFGNTFIEHGKG